MRRFKSGNRIQGACDAAARSDGVACHGVVSERAAQHVELGGLGGTGNIGLSSGGGALQNARAAKETPSKRPRGIEPWHLDALDAAGLGYSQSPSEF